MEVNVCSDGGHHCCIFAVRTDICIRNVNTAFAQLILTGIDQRGRTFRDLALFFGCFCRTVVITSICWVMLA